MAEQGQEPDLDTGDVGGVPTESPARDTVVDAALKPSVDRAVIVFLYLFCVGFMVLFLGSAVENAVFANSEENKSIFNFMLKFADTLGGSWLIAFEAVLVVFSLYFVNALSVRSWNILTYVTLGSLVGALLVAMEARTDAFRGDICDFLYVSEEKTASGDVGFGQACAEFERAGAIRDNLTAFVYFGVLANFVIFVSMLKREVASDFLRKLTKGSNPDGAGAAE